MTQANDTGRPLTGGKVAAMFCGGFGIIISVNLILAFNAVRTFPGVETKNVYVISQAFNADRVRQDALGWDLKTTLVDGTLHLAITDATGPVQPEIVSATFGRATTVADDVTPAFAWDGRRWSALVPNGAGNWNLRLELAAADGTRFRRRIPVWRVQ